MVNVLAIIGRIRTYRTGMVGKQPKTTPSTEICAASHPQLSEFDVPTNHLTVYLQPDICTHNAERRNDKVPPSLHGVGEVEEQRRVIRYEPFSVDTGAVQ